MFRKYWRRITRSARGELFNPLLWPFLMSTLAYGVGFTVFYPLTNGTSLFLVMAMLHTWIPVVWGIVALITILGGLTFLLFNVPPYGKASGILGFMLWLFAGFAYVIEGNTLLVFALAIPNMWFWIWQYLSLAGFRKEEAADEKELQEQQA